MRDAAKRCAVYREGVASGEGGETVAEHGREEREKGSLEKGTFWCVLSPRKKLCEKLPHEAALG